MADFSMMEFADTEANTPEFRKKIDRLFYQCNIELGGSSIPVHLEDPDYIFSFEKAVDVYRSMSSRSVVQTYGFLELQPTQSVYVLNERIDLVQRIYRGRGLFGGVGSGSGAFESFGAATANTLLRGGINPNAATVNLATYDFLLQYEETLARLFARELHFVYRNETHTLILTQVPRYNETVAMKVSVLKSFSELLDDHWSKNWLQKYTLAKCRIILGEKYSLFATMPGAQGGTVLKGEALKQQGQQDIEKLEQELLEYGDSMDIQMPVRG